MPASHGWRRPVLASRTGAAHLRRGLPCQDACGWQGLRDAADEPVQVLVVSDGHGGARYRRSDVGSRLACTIALQEVERAMETAATGRSRGTDSGEGGWAEWLAWDLPVRIVAGWCRAVEAHDRAHPETDSEGTDPAVLYGATLGLLVLTPHWWGHTGLGDWDLVRLRCGGPAELLSEEPERDMAGEATYSLCMPQAERHFRARSSLQRQTAADPPFQLLLCTDGIRKSCGSDADFLVLAGHLAELPANRPQGAPLGPPPELESALDHITHEGSGDDVSAVVAHWGSGPPAPGWHQEGPWILQPAPPTAAAAAPASPTLPVPSDRWPSVAPAPGATGGWRWRLTAPGLVGLAAAGAALAAWWLKLGPFAPAAAPALLPPETLAAIQRQVATLCDGPVSATTTAPAPKHATPKAAGEPTLSPTADDGLEGGARHPAEADSGRRKRIRSTLNQRRALFARLASATPAQLRTNLGNDPLTALVALSRLAPRSLVVPGEPPQASTGGPLGTHPTATPPPSWNPPVTVCPELLQELRARWAERRPDEAPSRSASPTSPLSRTAPPRAKTTDGSHNRRHSVRVSADDSP
ncbi:MAG: protein phosphatase 2C domain-containing protein [Synechococcaceae cyanobacterium]